MTRGASLRSRVKGNFQARFWSSGGRGDSPTDCRKLSDEAYALWLLGEIAAHRTPPDIDQAAAHYHQTLALAEELGMRPAPGALPPRPRHAVYHDRPAGASAG